MPLGALWHLQSSPSKGHIASDYRPNQDHNTTLPHSQVIDDEAGRTLVAASTLTSELKGELADNGSANIVRCSSDVHAVVLLTAIYPLSL